MATQVRRLDAFPRQRLVEDPLFTGTVSQLVLLEEFGPPTAEGDPLSDDPRLYWDLEFPCGLVMAIDFHQLDERVAVHLDADDVAHALRHLGDRVSDVTLLADRDPQRHRALVPAPPARNASLWRVDPDGGETLIAEGLTVRDAECRRVALRSRSEGGSLRVRTGG